MASSNISYYATPPRLDFGTVAVGDSQTQQIRLDYRLAPGSSAGSVLSTQTTVSGEVFLADDQGATNANQFVTLSTDNVNFFNRLNLSSFPATEPPNFITLFVNVAPTTANTNKQGDYVVYLKSVQNPAFAIPIHFRIAGGRYASVQDVRRLLGPLGKQRVTLQNTHDSFQDTTFALWTVDSGTWSPFRTSTRTGIDGATTDALSHVPFPDFGDYNTSVTLLLQSAGRAGIAFGIQNSSNYFRFTISSSDSLARAEQITSGAITTLSTLSVGDVNGSLTTGRQYNLRVEKHPNSFDCFMDESLVFRVYPTTVTPASPNQTVTPTITTINGPSGLVLASSGSAFVVDYNEFNVTQDTYEFSDADIIDYVLEAEKFVERRTQRVYTPQTLTEVQDWDDQDVIRMPFLISRSFNTLPNFDQRTAPITPVVEHALYLKRRPVLGVIALEENTTSDVSQDNWVLRNQGRGGDYVVYPELGKILFINNFPHNGHQSLKIIYTIGAPEVPPEVKQYVALRSAIQILSNIGGANDGIAQMVAKLEVRLKDLEAYIPQKTMVYAVGSKQVLR